MKCTLLHCKFNIEKFNAEISGEDLVDRNLSAFNFFRKTIFGTSGL